MVTSVVGYIYFDGREGACITPSSKRVRTRAKRRDEVRANQYLQLRLMEVETRLRRARLYTASCRDQACLLCELDHYFSEAIRVESHILSSNSEKSKQ